MHGAGGGRRAATDFPRRRLGRRRHRQSCAGRGRAPHARSRQRRHAHRYAVRHRLADEDHQRLVADGLAGQPQAPAPGRAAGRPAARHGRLRAGAGHDFPAAHAHGRLAAAGPPARQLWRRARRHRARRAARTAGRRAGPGGGLHGPRGADPRLRHRAPAVHAAGPGPGRAHPAPAGHGRHALRSCAATAWQASRAHRILRAGGRAPRRRDA